MFDVPGSDIATVVLTEDCVRGRGEAEYVRATVEDDDSGMEDEELTIRNP